MANNMPKNGSRRAARDSQKGNSISHAMQARTSAKFYTIKRAMYRMLKNKLLVVIPRENRGMYRTGLDCIRSGLAVEKLVTQSTLYLERAPTLTPEQWRMLDVEVQGIY